MRRMKKLLAVLLAAVMVMSMGSMSLMAATNTITITGVSSGRTYLAYQIFSGTYTNGALTNIATGSGLNVRSDDSDSIEAITKLLKSSTATINITFDYDGETYTELGKFVEAYLEAYANDSVAWIATLMSTYGNDNPNMVTAIAEITAQFLTTTYFTGSYNSTEETYTFSNLSDGYYLVVETTSSVSDGDSYSRYILVNAGSKIAVKSVTPSLEKEIVLTENSTEATTESTTTSIGDTVTYRLTSSVPDMTGYSSYTFIITDTISAGLTLSATASTANVSDAAKTAGLTELNLSIAVDGSTISGMRVYDADDASAASSYKYYYYTSIDSDNNTVLTIAFNDFINAGYSTGDAIVATYKAVLNDDAVIGSTGNDNEAYLTYSNNPNLTKKNTVTVTEEVTEYDEVSGTEYVTERETESQTEEYYTPSTETGKTVEEEAVVYTYELDLTKVDSVATTTTLSGAEFYLTETENDTTYYAIVKENTSGTDGYYTITGWTATESSKSTLTSGTAGELYITGLGTGTYYLYESKAPSGYTAWADPMTITITATTDSTGTTALAATIGTTDANGNASTGIIAASVTNSSSSSLPETGGIGTTMFYIAGVILVFGAATLLVTRRRVTGR